jgi:hypothetical protein
MTALHEPLALMWQDVLRKNGIHAMVKNMGGGLAYEWGRASTPSPDYDIFVKKSDLERAREVLGLGEEE